mmetsp:Transcript_25362/g.45760  ORF Transcript_25362/g.45760 Transcript_25362/m.45760 type:complete len:351 (+) Transcript_25362:205-1257(+)
MSFGSSKCPAPYTMLYLIALNGIRDSNPTRLPLTPPSHGRSTTTTRYLPRNLRIPFPPQIIPRVPHGPLQKQHPLLLLFQRLLQTLDLDLLHRRGSLRVLDGLLASIARGLGRESISHEASELAGFGILTGGEGFEGRLVPGGGRDDRGSGQRRRRRGLGFGGGGGWYGFGTSAGILIVVRGLDGSVGYGGVGRGFHGMWAIATWSRLARERYCRRPPILGSLVGPLVGLHHDIVNFLERRIHEHLYIEIPRKLRQEHTPTRRRRGSIPIVRITIVGRSRVIIIVVIQIRIRHGATFDFRNVPPADEFDRLAPGAESTTFPSGETGLDRIDGADLFDTRWWRSLARGGGR